jgi:hypothetical protein
MVCEKDVAFVRSHRRLTAPLRFAGRAADATAECFLVY